MKNLALKTLIFSMVLLTFFSCSMEKRHYTSGYYIDSKNSKSSLASNKQVKVNEEKTAKAYTKSVDNVVIPATTQTSQVNKLAEQSTNKITAAKSQTGRKVNAKRELNKAEGCDELILKNGTIVSAKIIEIGVEEIKYKKCQNQDGPNIAIRKSDVFMIKYSNGTTETFEEKKKEEVKTAAPANTQGATNTFAIISLVAGALGIIFIWFLGIVAIFFYWQRHRNRECRFHHRGRAGHIHSIDRRREQWW